MHYYPPNVHLRPGTCKYVRISINVPNDRPGNKFYRESESAALAFLPRLRGLRGTPVRILVEHSADHHKRTFLPGERMDHEPTHRVIASTDHFFHEFSSLYMAASHGLVEVVTSLLDNNCYEVDATEDASKETALHAASRNSQAAMVKLLLNKSANPSRKNTSGKTALDLATQPDVASLLRQNIFAAASTGDIESLKLFLARDRGSAAKRTDTGETALHYAATKVIVEQLLAGGADVNTRNNNEETPLHHAAKESRTEVADTLLAHGAIVGARDKRGDTALHEVAVTGCVSLGRILLKYKADVNAINSNNARPWSIAVRQGHIDLSDLLLAYNADATPDELGKLTWNISPKLLSVLARHGADVCDSLDHRGPIERDVLISSSIHVAAKFGKLREVEAMIHNNEALVNARDGKKQTPLHFAALEGKLEVAKLLFMHGADLNARTASGASPLHFAANRGRADLVEWLVINKASVNAEDDGGETPLHWAQKTNNGASAAAVLLQHGGR